MVFLPFKTRAYTPDTATGKYIDRCFYPTKQGLTHPHKTKYNDAKGVFTLQNKGLHTKTAKGVQSEKGVFTLQNKGLHTS
jgi:hypothetical protein